MDLLSGPPPPTTLVEEHGSWVEGGCSREPPDLDRRQPPPSGHSAAAVWHPVDSRRPDGRRQVRLLLGNRYDESTGVIHTGVPVDPCATDARTVVALNKIVTFGLVLIILLEIQRVACSRQVHSRRFQSSTWLLVGFFFSPSLSVRGVKLWELQSGSQS